MHKGKGCKRTWGCYNYSIYYKTVGPVTIVKIPGSAGGTAFILGHYGTDAGHTWHGFLAGLKHVSSAAWNTYICGLAA